MTVVTRAHGRFVFPRRVERLVGHLAAALPAGASVLDVGTGDGAVSRGLLDARLDLSIRGIDVLVRSRTQIPVEAFDGRRIPLSDAGVDYAMFVDVLHHTDDPLALLREALRISRRGLVIKDHLSESALDRATLRLMDWVGNAGHGVRLPYRYWARLEWLAAFRQLGLVQASWNEHLGLYPFPASLVFDRTLHFVTRLERPEGGA